MTIFLKKYVAFQTVSLSIGLYGKFYNSSNMPTFIGRNRQVR